MNTKTLLLTIGLLVMAAVSSLMALITAQKITFQHAINQKTPDFYMNNVIYTKLDAHGVINNQIHATRINHLEINNAYYFENPTMKIFSKDEQPWTINANHGKSEQGKEKIFLWDNVIIKQSPGPNNQNMDIETQSLTIYPDKR